MGLFPQPFIDDLRLQANIVQVVQEYVPLKRAGTTYKGLCPFHSEKTPSFHVNPDKGFFHCFGCGLGGDVFKFLELHEKVDFPDAVKMLAQKFGVSLPEPADGSGDDARRDAGLREALLKVHEVSAEYFREQLAGSAGARARQQLAERDVTAKTIEQLGLGYAPSSREGLKARLLKQGFAQGLLIQSGLVVARENGEVVDRFRNRLMVPISRDAGSVIAFGARSMDANQVPKYLNSPETAIYSKGRTLYGLNLTKTAIRKLGFVVLVEGYFDFAQVFQSDAAPVVATCGTALTPQQAQLLRRVTSKVILSFDPDAAGRGAAARSCEILVKEGFEVNVVVLDPGEDPDTFIRRNGPNQYRERLRTSRPYLEYVINREAGEVDLRSPDGRNRFIDKMRVFADLLPDEATKEIFAEKVAFTAGVTDGTVLIQFRKSFRGVRTSTRPILPNLGDLKEAEKGLIWALIHNTPSALEALAELDTEDAEYLNGREIFEVARSLHQEPADLIPSALIQRLSTVNAQLVANIASTAFSPAPPIECIRALKRLRWERDQAAIQREIDRLQQLGATQYGNEINNLWQRKKDLLHRIEDLT
jgi:DNA primase